MKSLYLTVLLFTGIISLRAQIVDKSGLVQLDLQDRTCIWLMPGYDQQGVHTYYYLPVNLRLALRPDKTPEFNFMTYRNEDGGEISGAILHFLLVWGLTSDQETEAEKILQSSVDSNAILAGAVMVEAPEDAPSVQVKGINTVADILRGKVSSEPVAPVLPGTKMAFSYRLSGEEAKTFEEALGSASIMDSVSIELKFRFRGGHRDLWFQKFKEEYYTIRTSMRDLLKPVLQIQKPGK